MKNGVLLTVVVVCGIVLSEIASSKACSVPDLSVVVEPDTVTPKRLGPIGLRLFVKNNSSMPVRVLLPQIVEGVMAGLEIKILAQKDESKGSLEWTDNLGVDFKEPSTAPQPNLNSLPSLVIPPNQRREIGYLNLTYWPVMNTPLTLQHKGRQINLRALDADKVCLKIRLLLLFLDRIHGWRQGILQARPILLRFAAPEHPLEADALRLIQLWDPLSSAKFTKSDEQLVLRYGLPLQNNHIVLDDEEFWRTIRNTFPFSIYGAKAGYWYACCLENKYKSEGNPTKKLTYLENAIDAFQWVVSNWPDTWYGYDARRRLKSLKANK